MVDTKLVEAIFADAKAVIRGDHVVYAKKADGWHHGYDYANKDAVYPFTRSVKTLCKMIAEHFRNDYPVTVVGPTVGGVALAQWTADWLTQTLPYEVHAVCADEEEILEERVIEKDFSGISSLAEQLGNLEFLAAGKVAIKIREGDLSPSKMTITYPEKVGTRRIIKRGYDQFIKGKLCLGIEDVINTGKTIEDVLDAVKRLGGIPIGVGALINRSGGKVTAETLGVPKLLSLLDLDMPMFKEEECPICKERGVESVRTDIGKGKEFLARIGKS